jgi:hypothetical protein
MNGLWLEAGKERLMTGTLENGGSNGRIDGITPQPARGTTTEFGLVVRGCCCGALLPA